MKIAMKISLLAILSLVPRISLAWTSLVVAADRGVCPSAGYSTIQSAVDAAEPGGTIRVCAGVYPEQVSISKSVTIHGDNGAVLLPDSMTSNASSLVDGAPIAAALFVSNATNVSISGLIVDGAGNGITECAPKLEGVLYQNASGSVTHTTVRNFKLSLSLNGCQSGTGVFVQSGNGRVSSVTIEDCSIHDFQKNGLTADENGTTVFVHRNVVTGIGPTSGAAQNGIQVGFGAQGTIKGNTVTNNLWSGCTTVATCQAVATDILVTGSDGVEVMDNRAGVAQIPVYIVASNVAVLRNEVFASNVFDGIRVEGGENAVAANHVFDGAESGVYLMGDFNFVLENVITDAPVGIFEAAGSLGTFLLSNQYFGVPVRVQDPPSTSLANLVQADR